MSQEKYLVGESIADASDTPPTNAIDDANVKAFGMLAMLTNDISNWIFCLLTNLITFYA